MPTNFINNVEFDKGKINSVNFNNVVPNGKSSTVKKGGATDGWQSAIATEGFASTVDGEYIAAARIDTIGDGNIVIGVTTQETVDSNVNAYPGGGLSGVGFQASNGYLIGHGACLITGGVANAKEVIMILNIAGSGARKEMYFIVGGIASTVCNCTSNLNGPTIFPVVSLYQQNQQVTMIPIAQVQTKSPLVAGLIAQDEELRKPKPQPENPAVAPIRVIPSPAEGTTFRAELVGELKGTEVGAVLFGLAAAGKSTAFNFFNCIFKGRKLFGLRETGVNATAGAQLSKFCSRDAASDYFENWNANRDGNLTVTDTVGFKGDESEIKAIGEGKLMENEAWPRDDSEASINKRYEIVHRPAQTVRPTCFALLISAEQLENKQDKANDDFIKSVFDMSRRFEVGNLPVGIPLLVCITKVDKILDSAVTMEELLFQRTSTALEPIFKKCQDRFGVDPSNMLALGWLDETDSTTDFSDTSKDPRVLTARHLILQIAETGKRCAAKMEKLRAQVTRTAVIPAHNKLSSAPMQLDQRSSVESSQFLIGDEVMRNNNGFAHRLPICTNNDDNNMTEFERMKAAAAHHGCRASALASTHHRSVSEAESCFPVWMSSLPVDDEVKSMLVKQKIDEESFKMLEESDLKEMEFPIGPRKLLWKEIQKRN